MVNYDCQNYHDNKIASLAYKDHKFLKNTHTHIIALLVREESLGLRSILEGNSQLPFLWPSSGQAYKRN